MTDRVFLKRFKRLTRGLFVTEISEKLGVSRSTIAHWLAGESLPHPAAQKLYLKALTSG